jgi:hypothetical protein
MAVNFQRRNIGVLADTPTFEDVGRSSYTDYVAAAARAPVTSVMPAAVKAAEVQKTPALAGPQTPEAMAEYEAAQLAALQRAEEAALRQRQSVKNPLNVVGNAISAVVGTPFRLLENAIGGGNNDLAAPFRPNQTAQDRYQSKLADISTAKLGLTQTMDSLRANQTQAITNALTNRSELMGQVYDIAANLAQNAKGAANPEAVYAQGLANLMQDPLYAPVAKSIGLDQMAYSPDLARSLARGKDVTSRLDEMNKPSFGSITENGTGVIYNPDGTIKQLIQYGDSGPAGAPPPVSLNPTPNPTPQGLPPLDAIDAEIKRRIEAQGSDGVTMPQPPPSPGQQPQQLISAEDYARMETALGPQGVQSWMRANNITQN